MRAPAPHLRVDRPCYLRPARLADSFLRRPTFEETRMTGMRRALFAMVIGVSLPSWALAQSPKPRARDLGVPFDGTPGPLNAITDIAGIEVGETTIIRGGPARMPPAPVSPSSGPRAGSGSRSSPAGSPATASATSPGPHGSTKAVCSADRLQSPTPPASARCATRSYSGTARSPN